MYSLFVGSVFLAFIGYRTVQQLEGIGHLLLLLFMVLANIGSAVIQSARALLATPVVLALVECADETGPELNCNIKNQPPPAVIPFSTRRSDSRSKRICVNGPN